jgi:hypothetical protein
MPAGPQWTFPIQTGRIVVTTGAEVGDGVRTTSGSLIG